MNVLSILKNKLAPALLVLALCTNDATALMRVFSSCFSRNKSCTEQSDKSTIQYKDDQLKKLLYDLLDTLPMELICIIVEYDHCKIKKLSKTFCCPERIGCLIVLTNGYLASGATNNRDDSFTECPIRIWDPSISDETKACIKTFKGHTDPITCLLQLADQQLLVSASEDYSIRVWDLNATDDTKACIKNIDSQNEYAQSMVQLDKNHIATAHNNIYGLCIWDLSTESLLCESASQYHRSIQIIKLPNNILIGFNPSNTSNGYAFGYCQTDTGIQVWHYVIRPKLSNVNITSVLNSDIRTSEEITAPCIPLSENTICSGHIDGSIRTWSIDTTCANGEPSVLRKRQNRKLDDYTKAVIKLLLLTNGNLAATFANNTAEIWNLKTKTCLFTITNLSDPSLLNQMPNTNQLVIACQDPKNREIDVLQIQDTDTGECLQVLPPKNGNWWHILCIPGDQIINYYSDSEKETGKIQIWH